MAILANLRHDVEYSRLKDDVERSVGWGARSPETNPKLLDGKNQEFRLMRLPRIYQDAPLQKGQLIRLSHQASHHLLRVLRMRPQQSLIIFNGQDVEYTAQIETIDNQQALVRLHQAHYPHVESPLQLHLAQAIAKGNKMDWIIEKAVELGVSSMTPLFTDRTQIKLTTEKQTKRVEHWQKVVISACEQCGRVKVPKVHPPQSLADWLAQSKSGLKLTLIAQGQQHLKDLTPLQGPVYLTIGPEGGFSDKEIDMLESAGFHALTFGPRILRTETAGIVALTALQSWWGDLG